MRVIAGTAKGRVLRSPRGPRIRPTSDRVKEALFNIIADRVRGARVLDLFAGTGALGIEALSRGASLAVFVDWHRESTRLIRTNLELTGFLPRAEVYRQDAAIALGMLHRKGRVFDLVFLDPPYGEEKGDSVLRELARRNILTPGGLVVVEHARGRTMIPRVGDLELQRQRHYGDTVLSFYSFRSEKELEAE